MQSQTSLEREGYVQVMADVIGLMCVQGVGQLGGPVPTDSGQGLAGSLHPVSEGSQLASPGSQALASGLNPLLYCIFCWWNPQNSCRKSVQSLGVPQHRHSSE